MGYMDIHVFSQEWDHIFSSCPDLPVQLLSERFSNALKGAISAYSLFIVLLCSEWKHTLRNMYVLIPTAHMQD